VQISCLRRRCVFGCSLSIESDAWVRVAGIFRTVQGKDSRRRAGAARVIHNTTGGQTYVRIVHGRRARAAHGRACRVREKADAILAPPPLPQRRSA
jgi:hypothetical protein